MIKLVLGAGGFDAVKLPELFLTHQIITLQINAGGTNDICRNAWQRQAGFRPSRNLFQTLNGPFTQLDPMFLPGQVPHSLAGTFFWGVRTGGSTINESPLENFCSTQVGIRKS